MHIILGSQSPRRREILGYFTLPFTQKPSDFNESSIPYQGNPSDYVCKIAEGKGTSLSNEFPDDVIVTSDTVVIFDEKVFGKPSDEDDALKMLMTLSGNWHEVYTGISVRKGSTVYSDFEVTRVLLNNMTQRQIRAYQKRCHSIDKAAGYAIQREGSIIVKEIQGCYYNVMGLPINSLHTLLLKLGIDLWDYIV